VVELEPVHLGPDDLVVDAPFDGPALRVDRGEAVLEGFDPALLRGHGRGRIVGHAVDDPRLLELAELLPEGEEIFVAPSIGYTRVVAAPLPEASAGAERSALQAASQNDTPKIKTPATAPRTIRRISILPSYVRVHTIRH
jgi:hypothetical protein